MTRIGFPPSGAPPSVDAAQARRDRGETPRDPFRDPRRDGGQSAFGQNRDGLGRRDPGSDGTRSQARTGGGAKESHRDALPGFGASASPFGRLVEEQAQDREGRHGSERDRDDGQAEHVLAIAEPRTDGPVSLPARPDQPIAVSVTQTVEATPPLPPGEGDRMIAIAERVDAALRLDRMAEARGEGTFRLVGDAACGLESVGVSLTGATLDVTLTHGFAAHPDDLARAAALLAQQLGDRFPAKRVRILQAVASLDTASPGPDGLAAIGRWLSRPAS